MKARPLILMAFLYSGMAAIGGLGGVQPATAIQLPAPPGLPAPPPLPRLPAPPPLPGVSVHESGRIVVHRHRRHYRHHHYRHHHRRHHHHG
jgi:hypothetical protein